MGVLFTRYIDRWTDSDSYIYPTNFVCGCGRYKNVKSDLGIPSQFWNLQNPEIIYQLQSGRIFIQGKNSGHTADSKLSYTIQFFILIFCAQISAGPCGSSRKIWQLEKYDNFFCIKNIPTSIIQESRQAADSKLNFMTQFSILILCVKYQEAQPRVVPEKSVTEIIFYDADNTRWWIVIV